MYHHCTSALWTAALPKQDGEHCFQQNWITDSKHFTKLRWSAADACCDGQLARLHQHLQSCDINSTSTRKRLLADITLLAERAAKADRQPTRVTKVKARVTPAKAALGRCPLEAVLNSKPAC